MFKTKIDFHIISKLNFSNSAFLLGHYSPLKDFIQKEYINFPILFFFLVLENILTLTSAVGQGHILNNHFDTEAEC